MKELAERIHDNEHGHDYVLVEDYDIPDLALDEIDERPIGR